MTSDEFVLRFPEIPDDLHKEPLLAEFAEVFDQLLKVATKPSACAEVHNAENQYYLKLVGPMDIYRYGLYTRDRVMDELQSRLNEYREDPTGFATRLTAK